MKTKKIKLFFLTIIVLLILLAGCFVYQNFFASKINNYRIENKYYGFKLQTPKGWIAQEQTFYTEDNIKQLIDKCENDKSINTVGVIRFESQKYPDNFSTSESSQIGLSSGVILEVTVNCLPGDIKLTKTTGPGLEKIIYNNNFQYRIDGYTYISSADKSNENKIKENYTNDFNKIISSFLFIK